MTYTEWRDELKKNLLCVSEAERRRVLDYYAEAYADRREAGFSEREITDEFGAPYDAAQRILYDKTDDDNVNTQNTRARMSATRDNFTPPPPPQPQPASSASAAAAAKSADYTWVFVLLCVLFAVPLFGLVMGMVGITIGFCVAPIAVIGSGAAIAGSAIGSIIGGSVAYGLSRLGVGIIVLGIGIILCPLFFKLVELMWKLFKAAFSWLNNLFKSKEKAI